MHYINSGSSTKLNAILPGGAHFSGDYKKSRAKHWTGLDWTGLEQFEEAGPGHRRRS